jgi:hypothetical protein
MDAVGRRQTMADFVNYSDVYKSLDGITALSVATSMPLRKHKDEKDTAFVKRIVACYLTLALRHDVGLPSLSSQENT